MTGNIFFITLALLGSTIAAERGVAPQAQAQKNESLFPDIENLYNAYEAETNPKEKINLKIKIVSGINALLKSGRITKENRDKAIEIAQGIGSTTLTARLEEADLSNKDIGSLTVLSKELTDTILKMVSQGSTVEQLKEMLTISKGFNKLFLTAPIHLDLASTRITVENLEKLFMVFPNITALNLSVSWIGEAEATALAHSPHLQSLTSLVLSGNNIGDVGVTALANSPNLQNLTSLVLIHSNIGDAGAIALANSPNLKNLTSLNLVGNQIGDKGATALADSPNLQNLTSLKLFNNSKISNVKINELKQLYPGKIVF